MRRSLVSLAVGVALQDLAKSERAAYSDGIDAGYRVGPYEGAKDTPTCPFEDDTVEAKKWWQGFGDGTEDLIAIQRLEITDEDQRSLA